MACRVFVDAPLYRSQTRGGVNRFVSEITGALTESDGFETVFYSRDINGILANHLLRRPYFRGWGYLPLLDRLVTSVALLRWQPDLYFNTYYAWQPYARIPTVCAVYDLIHERFPEQFAIAPRFLVRKEQVFRQADRLLCDSEATSNDLLEFYPFVDPSSVHVIHLGVDTAFFRPVGSEIARNTLRAKIGDGKYWLFVGRREFPYKNFEGLLQGFALSQSVSTHRLVVIGGQSDRSAAERKLLGGLGLADSVVLLGRVSDEVLRAAYVGAEALVYPSLYEGFGLPLLEAMACGTLVLSSGAASLPEVGGDVSLYFEPRVPMELATMLDRAATMGASERAWRIQRGLERARHFSWQRCAGRVVDLFSAIVPDGNRSRRS